MTRRDAWMVFVGVLLAVAIVTGISLLAGSAYGQLVPGANAPWIYPSGQFFPPPPGMFAYGPPMPPTAGAPGGLYIAPPTYYMGVERAIRFRVTWTTQLEQTHGIPDPRIWVQSWLYVIAGGPDPGIYMTPWGGMLAADPFVRIDLGGPSSWRPSWLNWVISEVDGVTPFIGPIDVPPPASGWLPMQGLILHWNGDTGFFAWSTSVVMVDLE